MIIVCSTEQKLRAHALFPVLISNHRTTDCTLANFCKSGFDELKFQQKRKYELDLIKK